MNIEKIFRQRKSAKPRNGVSTPHTNSSVHIICRWVPSSGIPSIIGISTIDCTLVFQKPAFLPCQNHRATLERRHKAPASRTNAIIGYIISSSGVREVMRFLEARNGDVSIHLCRGKAFVTQ